MVCVNAKNIRNKESHDYLDRNKIISEKYFRELFNKLFTEIQGFLPSFSHSYSFRMIGGKEKILGEYI
jgi:hypothetical protein